MRLLAPDDAADLVQALPGEERSGFMGLLDQATRGEVTALLAYAEDAAGGVMNPRYMRLRPDITVEVAIRYLRRQAIRGIEVIDYAYVLGPDLQLQGVVSFRELFAAPPEKLVDENTIGGLPLSPPPPGGLHGVCLSRGEAINPFTRKTIRMLVCA